jgi:glycosyltransferase involved in cell wall biosynthesis
VEADQKIDPGTRLPAGNAVETCRVSIVTRTRNRPITLDRALRSILAQSFQDWELILVSDAGDLSAVEGVLARHAVAMRGRCRLLHRAVSTGMEAASNFGIAHCRHRFLVLHDDDDSWHPAFLEKTVGLLRGAGSSFQGVVAGTQQILEQVDGGGIREFGRQDLPHHPDLLKVAALRRRNRFPPIAFVYERYAWEALGGYREDLPALGDWEFNVRFASRYNIAALPDVIAYWHHRSKARDSFYANSSYRSHMRSLMRLRREWGEQAPLWRYLLLWRY